MSKDVQYERGTSSVHMRMCTARKAHYQAFEKRGTIQKHFCMNHYYSY